jgi:glucose/arabinose dehydrogenase
MASKHFRSGKFNCEKLSNNGNEIAWGRPVQPFVMSDGSMLISDDKYNAIYRISYKG